jgi:hypothetical protein
MATPLQGNPFEQNRPSPLVRQAASAMPSMLASLLREIQNTRGYVWPVDAHGSLEWIELGLQLCLNSSSHYRGVMANESNR